MADTFRKPTQRSDAVYGTPKEQYLAERYDHSRHVRAQQIRPNCQPAGAPVDGACVAPSKVQMRREQMYDRQEGTRDFVASREVDERTARKSSREFAYARAYNNRHHAHVHKSSVGPTVMESTSASHDESAAAAVAVHASDIEKIRATKASKGPIVFEKEKTTHEAVAAAASASSASMAYNQRRAAMQTRDPRPHDRFEQMSEAQAARMEMEKTMTKTNYGSSLYRDDADVTVNKGIFVGRKDAPYHV